VHLGSFHVILRDNLEANEGKTRISGLVDNTRNATAPGVHVVRKR
jgi:hypothetical protein